LFEGRDTYKQQTQFEYLPMAKLGIMEGAAGAKKKGL
jgi:hypothetical protein